MPGSASKATQKAIIFIQNLMNCQLEFWGQYCYDKTTNYNFRHSKSLFVYVSKIEWVEL